MTLRLAACSCGQLTARVTAEPVRVSVCHCLACQRRTGGPFAQQARFPREQVEVAGESTPYVRVGDEGTRAHFHFCPHCGVTVWYAPEAFPDFLVIPVGVFAEPGFPGPTVSVYESRKHAWVTMPEGIEHYD